jgi:transcriptional regulator with XRE-family HTH domain
MTSGQFIKQRRETLGMTVDELSSRSGIDKLKLQSIENDVEKANVEDIKALSSVLKTSTDSIVFGGVNDINEGSVKTDGVMTSDASFKATSVVGKIYKIFFFGLFTCVAIGMLIAIICTGGNSGAELIPFYAVLGLFICIGLTGLIFSIVKK